jgi:hypothetical protein
MRAQRPHFHGWVDRKSGRVSISALKVSPSLSFRSEQHYPAGMDLGPGLGDPGLVLDCGTFDPCQ